MLPGGSAACLCSLRYTPCQMPSARRPCCTGTVRLAPISDDCRAGREGGRQVCRHPRNRKQEVCAASRCCGVQGDARQHDPLKTTPALPDLKQSRREHLP